MQDARHYENLWATIRERRVWRGEIVDRRKDGTLYTVIQTVTPILDARGAITHYVAVHDDVTLLRAGQARLQALFDHALDGIMLFDDDARVIDANRAMSAMTGYPMAQLATMTLDELVPEAYRSRYHELWARFRADGRGRGGVPIVRRDGQLRDIEYQSVAGITEGVNLLIAQDVSEKRRGEEQQRFQAQLLEAVGDAVIATDLTGLVRYVNPAAERLYGWSEQQVLGRAITELTVPDGAAARAEEIMSQVRNGKTWTGRFEVRRHDGTSFPALVTNAAYLDATGQLAGIIGVSTDVSDLERSQALLVRRVRQQTVVAELGQAALDTHDPRSLGDLASDMAAELLGPDVPIHFSLPGSAAPQRTTGGVRIHIGASGAFSITGPGAEDLPADDHEFLRALAHIVQAARQRHAATTQLEHLAIHDPLTGLLNRVGFLGRLTHARATAARSGRRFTVLFLDLDGLKVINDGLGHATGDEVLQLVAELLNSVAGPADTVARFGGDEFALLCPDVADEHAAKLVAERVRTALAAGASTDRGTVPVTASIGIVLGDGMIDDAALLRDVDTAMYAAKAAGRNRTEVFNPRMQDQATDRFRMVLALRTALEHDGVEVHYQPTIEVATGRMIGVEALARLRAEDGSIIPPNDFIWVAEQTGVIDVLGAQVLRRACLDAQPWIAADPTFTLSVNLAPRQLTSPDISETVATILAETGLDPTSLVLEITESALLAGPEVAATMTRLRRSGIRLAIDDFGTGYSSLAHLRHMPVDILKIDRSFVSGLKADIQDHALVAATIHLAHAFGLPTTAEGVETPEQLAELARLGCNHAQGYLWSPPVRAPRISEMLHTSPPAPGGPAAG
ncbi:MAG: EAL domain-containing protein [Egibacteraceae bacterium]